MIYKFTISSSKKKRRRNKVIARAVTLLLMPILVIGILLFILYPHYNKLVIAKEELDAKKIAQSSTISFFTSISPKPDEDVYEQDFSNKYVVEYISPEKLAEISNEGEILNKLEDDDTEIIAGTANIKADIIDGENAYAMEKGPWHFPLSKGPGERGNFVVIGHRFAELPPSTNTFYNLDKLDVGDKIKIKQKGGIEYTYTVIESKVVGKNDRSVLADTKDYRLTLITCTPLWTSKERLIVVAVLDRAYQAI